MFSETWFCLLENIVDREKFYAGKYILIRNNKFFLCAAQIDSSLWTSRLQFVNKHIRTCQHIWEQLLQNTLVPENSPHHEYFPCTWTFPILSELYDSKKNFLIRLFMEKLMFQPIKATHLWLWNYQQSLIFIFFFLFTLKKCLIRRKKRLPKR